MDLLPRYSPAAGERGGADADVDKPIWDVEEDAAAFESTARALLAWLAYALVSTCDSLSLTCWAASRLCTFLIEV